jgi:hypothetical protein
VENYCAQFEEVQMLFALFAGYPKAIHQEQISHLQETML